MRDREPEERDGQIEGVRGVRKEVAAAGLENLSQRRRDDKGHEDKREKESEFFPNETES